jgi:RsmE family RNA methyltransferase
MNVVLFEPGEVLADGTVTLTGSRARHLLSVLKVDRAHPVRVGLVDGPLGTASVAGISADVVTLRCAFDAGPPARPLIDLLLALPRPKVLRRLWAQLAALGVGRIMLTNAARVERNYFDTHVLSERVFRPLLIEGLQQARDTRLPIVTVHRQFRVLVEDDLDGLVEPGLRLVAHPGHHESLPAIVGRRKPGRVVIAIGPEGGWNAFELGLLESRGFATVAMGARTLRTDTACVALLALAHEALTLPAAAVISRASGA